MKGHIFVETYTFDLIDSKMYIIAEGKSALIIDPCVSGEACERLQTSGVEELLIVLTHEHYDHISGIGFWRERFDKCCVLCSGECGRLIRSPLLNASKYFAALVIDKDEETRRKAQQIRPVSYEADEVFYGIERLSWQDHELILTETPGHSPGSICILLEEQHLFTGDSLLRDVPVILKLPGGSEEAYRERTLPYLKKLAGQKQGIRVYPGHGEGFLLEDVL